MKKGKRGNEENYSGDSDDDTLNGSNYSDDWADKEMAVIQ